MDRRLFASGAGTIALGLAVFLVLAVSGALRHPAAAAEQTTRVEFVAIGGGLVLLLVGVFAAFLAVVRPTIESETAP
ncbi:hypothetical protein ACFO5R_13940 [Halosolutus amylolyticus]|uniref:Transporter n=1 Tax=Halosolutus amylolyticus TaxID=2932267 RepID=A0ABD5PR50_9EURY|nr:hypothetical protein [Halosolutus amylolyticus]